MAKKKIPELPPLNRPAVAGDLVAGWDGQANKTVGIDVTKLPGTGGGGDPVTFIAQPSPIMVFTTSDCYSYNALTNVVKITDTRLLNKQAYPVSTDQFGGGEFNYSKIAYIPVDPDDDTKGSVTIADFELDPAAHITIIVPGSKDESGDAVYAALLADVALLKAMVSPFTTTPLGPNGAKVWWIGAVADIPAGWQICEAMKGYYPVAIDADNFDLNIAPAHEVGADSITLVAANLPKVIIDLPTNDAAIIAGGAGRYVGTSQTSGDTAHASFGSDAPTAVKNRPKSLSGHWIEFIGIA